MRMTKLSEFAYFVSTKIDVKKLTRSNYIGVDNMLQNKNGITKSEYLPDNGYAIAFQKNDILIGNIRPYLKKIWLATFDGGCSQDVLCLRCNNSCLSGFIFSLLSQDCFFDYVMKGSKGTRMARGDKKHILNYKFCDISNKEQIGQLITNLNKKIFLNNQINDNLLQTLETIFDYYFSNDLYGETNIKYICEIIWGQCPDGNNILDLSANDDNAMLYCSGAGDMRGGFIVDCQAKTNASRRIALPGDILLSVAGSIGSYSYCNQSISLGRAAVAFRPKNKELAYFVYMLVKKYSRTLIKQAIGSVQKVISDANLSIFNFNYDLNKIHNHKDLNLIIEKLISINQETNRLKSLRDYLLPLLLNGQITVR